jgi:phospholipid/cholesterol/gamma-HCH transport system ATP-binding protein
MQVREHPVEQNQAGVKDGEPVVKIRDLKKSFNGRSVLNGVDLDLLPSENLVIIGRSGTGKSVLIKCMVGLIKPDDGEINVLGRNVIDASRDEMHEIRLQVGFSFQGSALYDSMTVRENLEFPLKRNLNIREQKELDQRVNAALEDVGLAEAAEQFPAELSGGMKKRIGIARTLILQPKIMLYDEPTAGLDPITSQEINELILQVRDKYHTASIIITHDISCAHTVGDRMAVLMDGKNKLEGSFETVKQSNDPGIHAFFNY